RPLTPSTPFPYTTLFRSQAMRLAADLDLVDLARGGVDAIDLVVEAAAQPQVFTVGADIAHVGTAAVGNRPGRHHLARGELDHRHAASGVAFLDHHLVGAAVGDIEKLAVAAGIEAVRADAGRDEADLLERGAVDH